MLISGKEPFYLTLKPFILLLPQAQVVSRQDNRVHFVLGQLVDDVYLDRVAEEVNETLQLEGTVAISSKSFCFL